MRPPIIAGIACFLVLIGCTHVRPTVPAAAPPEPERAATVPSGTALPAPTGAAGAEPGNGPKTTPRSPAAGAGSSSQRGAGRPSPPKPTPATPHTAGNAPPPA